MKINKLFVLLLILCTKLFSQVNTVVNYDFNTSSSYPVLPVFTETGITSSAASTEAFQVYSGTATSSMAFIQNTTAGNALAMANSSGTNTKNFVFQLGGSDLVNYQSFKIYLQAQRSSTGASLITLAYSTNGSSYTNFSSTYNVGTAFADISADLSSITSLNGSSTVYFKLMVSGASGTGTIRIDNFQVRATRSSGGGSGNGWTLNGNNVTTLNNVGIGTTSPAFPLDVNGNTRVNGSLTSSNLSLTSLTGTGNRNLFVSPSGMIGAASGPGLSPNSCIPGAPQWSMGGDNISGLTYGDNTIGTCDPTDFILKANATKRLWVKQDGRIGINHGSPDAALSIYATNYTDKILALHSIGGGIFVTEKTNLLIETADWNPGKTFLMNHYSDDFGNLEIFSTDFEGNTKISSINTTTANPAFTVKGIDLTSDYQDRLGTTFKIYGNQNGDVSSSGDMSLYVHNGKDFRIFSGNPSDGGLNGIGADATLRFSINGLLTNLTPAVEIGNPNMYGNIGINSALKVNADSSAKAITVHRKIGTSISNVESFVVYSDGRVGIGTPLTTNPNNYKLAVNGAIGCKSFKVEINSSTWSDFVFDKDYKLMGLPELESFINKNKHLPNIPSNAEVDANNGVDVVEIESKLLQKVEELTLYIIQQQKEIEELKKAVKK